MLVTCVVAVRGLMNRASAICGLDWPATRRRNTSISRGVKPAARAPPASRHEDVLDVSDARKVDASVSASVERHLPTGGLGGGDIGTPQEQLGPRLLPG